MSTTSKLLLELLVLCVFNVVVGQEEVSCYGPGSIVATVFITLIVTIVLLFLLYLFLTRYLKRKKERHLILETDPEKGKGEYAFDNPGFKDATLSSSFKETEKSNKSPSDSLKTKWTNWSPLNALSSNKSDKKTTFLDDSAIGKEEIKVVCLRSHDFTGLGFNIFGNMRDGIFIKDILHRGPAFESGKLKPGDCIKSITINFEHIVYEDALTILSYASPYEVIIEAHGEKRPYNPSSQVGLPRHPLFRSSSNVDLVQVGKTPKKRLFQANTFNNSLNSSFSSLQKSRSNATTLERKQSDSPNLCQQKDTLKAQLEQRILEDHDLNLHKNLKRDDDLENEQKKKEEKMQKSENKFHKFGIRVLPPEISPNNNKEQVSPKTVENSQNDNNVNLEKNSLYVSVMKEYDRLSLDEVDKNEEEKNAVEEDLKSFQRSPNHSISVKRDENGIPQEIPNHMHDVAMMAKRNRKSSSEMVLDEGENSKVSRKNKGRAPAPPEEKNVPVNTNIENGEEEKSNLYEIENKNSALLSSENALDSDFESDNQSSVNTIALNSNDITIHQTEDDEEIRNRKTASTGDLSKMQKSSKKSSGGTLERAQSLDIADSKIRRSDKLESTESDDSFYEKYLLNREPRLSLVLDGLNTFQRTRLKKSTEWGNLEDAILNLDKAEYEEDRRNSIGTPNSREFDALVDKINEIKKEGIRNSEDEKKVVLHKTYNDLTEIMDDEETDRNNSKHSKNTKLNSLLLTVQDANTLQNLNEISLDNVELELADDDFSQEDSSSAKNHASVPTFCEESSETNGITTSEIEMYLSEDAEDQKKAEIPKRTKKNQIWPAIENNNKEKPAVPARKSDRISKIDLTTKNAEEIEPKKCQTTTTVTLNSEINMGDDELNKKSNVQISTRFFKPTLMREFSENLIRSERTNCDTDPFYNCRSGNDLNVSDDIKVSRHSLSNVSSMEQNNVSNILIESPSSSLIPVNDSYLTESTLYMTASDQTLTQNPNNETITMVNKQEEEREENNVPVTTPDIIKNITLTEVINTVNTQMNILGEEDDVKPLKLQVFGDLENNSNERKERKNVSRESNEDDSNDSLTFVTEIHVSPTTNNNNNYINNNLEDKFENYVKNFEANRKVFSSQENTSNSSHQRTSPESRIPFKIDRNQPEKELKKIQEIVEEQLKKLPEMKFSTSSYETNSSSKSPEKRSSHIEQIRSNFEKNSIDKSPTKPKTSDGGVKSRIPVAMQKTPPTSPERRDSRASDTEINSDILELMSSKVHSTPITTNLRYQQPNKSPSKMGNVTVTPIRATSSKIPSGIPGPGKPPIPNRKPESSDYHQNGNGESSFKQWVFTQTDSAVTNIMVENVNKSEQK